MPPEPLRKKTSVEQMRWVRRRLDALFKDACRYQIKGWAFAAALQGWQHDYEGELGRAGQLCPADKEMIK
jgi:hypothetical protein